MLISILAFVIAYQNRIKELQDADTVNILRYYEDDIVSNSYSDLMDINVVNICHSQLPTLRNCFL